MLHTGSMVVHWVVCCLTALGFNLKLRLLCGVLEETHVFAGFLQSLWIPPTLQKHAGKYTSSVCSHLEPTVPMMGSRIKQLLKMKNFMVCKKMLYISLYTLSV